MHRSRIILAWCGLSVLISACQREPAGQTVAQRKSVAQERTRADAGQTIDTDKSTRPSEPERAAKPAADVSQTPSVSPSHEEPQTVNTKPAAPATGKDQPKTADVVTPSVTPSAPAPAIAAGASPAGDKESDSASDVPAETDSKGTPGDDKPLMLDDEPPLLLDDGPEDDPDAGPVADNSRCLHCHLNMSDEELAMTHARANIGCAKCHGNCDAHIADESWASGGNGTPPEIMYPRDTIQAACMKCHPRDKIDVDEHAEWLTGKVKDKVCTDCHGEHRIPGQRKCKWK